MYREIKKNIYIYVEFLKFAKGLKSWSWQKSSTFLGAVKSRNADEPISREVYTQDVERVEVNLHVRRLSILSAIIDKSSAFARILGGRFKPFHIERRETIEKHRKDIIRRSCDVARIWQTRLTKFIRWIDWVEFFDDLVSIDDLKNKKAVSRRGYTFHFRHRYIHYRALHEDWLECYALRHT